MAPNLVEFLGTMGRQALNAHRRAASGGIPSGVKSTITTPPLAAEDTVATDIPDPKSQGSAF